MAVRNRLVLFHLILPELLLHHFFLQPDAVEQGEKMQGEQRRKHDPGLRNNCKTQYLRDNVQKIIRMPDIFKQRAFDQLMVLGNIQFEGPKATERADHIYEERHCNRVNQQPDIRMRTDRHIHYESVNDRAYVDEELHHDQQLAVGLPVFHPPPAMIFASFRPEIMAEGTRNRVSTISMMPVIISNCSLLLQFHLCSLIDKLLIHYVGFTL